MSAKPDPEDELAGTEQPFVEHLVELRDRLIRALIAVGVALAWLLPRGSWAQRARAAAGMALGAASIAVLKCQALVLGEAFGLLGGLALGVVLSGLGRPLVERAVRGAFGR